MTGNETLALKWMYLSGEVPPVKELAWEGREQTLAVFLDPYQSWLLLRGSKSQETSKMLVFLTEESAPELWCSYLRRLETQMQIPAPELR